MAREPAMLGSQQAPVRTIVIAEEFSRTPGGRHIRTGPFSGELFRKEKLEPALRAGPVIVDLNGADTYIGSFLEEAFGGLLREGFTVKDVSDRLRIIADGEFTIFRDLAMKYIAEEAQKSQTH